MFIKPFAVFSFSSMLQFLCSFSKPFVFQFSSFSFHLFLAALESFLGACAFGVEAVLAKPIIFFFSATSLLNCVGLLNQSCCLVLASLQVDSAVQVVIFFAGSWKWVLVLVIFCSIHIVKSSRPSQLHLPTPLRP